VTASSTLSYVKTEPSISKFPGVDNFGMLLHDVKDKAQINNENIVKTNKITLFINFSLRLKYHNPSIITQLVNIGNRLYISSIMD
jgi:hypothetical protein